jgi:hypothetical protein
MRYLVVSEHDLGEIVAALKVMLREGCGKRDVYKFIKSEVEQMADCKGYPSKVYNGKRDPRVKLLVSETHASVLLDGSPVLDYWGDDAAGWAAAIRIHGVRHSRHFDENEVYITGHGFFAYCSKSQYMAWGQQPV